jgi:hypothetical protein
MDESCSESTSGPNPGMPGGGLGCNAASASCRPLHKENQRPRSRRHMGSRLWQLPQASIEEYASWISEKPEMSQTPSEKLFLQKFHRRMLIQQQKSPMETMRHYITRLEHKRDLSDVELQLIEAYHRRKAKNRARRRDSNPFRESMVPPTIFWKRESSLKNPPPHTPILSTIANLQESMNRMGLSSNKLFDIPLEEDLPKSNAGESTSGGPGTNYFILPFGAPSK